MSRQRYEAVPVRTLEVRLHNRRVRGSLMRDGTLLFRFKRMRSDRTIHTDRIRISREALAAMLQIANDINRPDVADLLQALHEIAPNTESEVS